MLLINIPQSSYKVLPKKSLMQTMKFYFKGTYAVCVQQESIILSLVNQKGKKLSKLNKDNYLSLLLTGITKTSTHSLSHTLLGF